MNIDEDQPSDHQQEIPCYLITSRITPGPGDQTELQGEAGP
jgi:hypothetical protein